MNHFLPGRILDFGCGTGYFLKRLATRFSADGFEISKQGAGYAKELNPNATIYSNFEEIPRDCYYGITALHVFEHITDTDLIHVLKTLRQILIPGGRLLCVVPELGGRGHLLKQEQWAGFMDPTHINLKTRAEWLNLLSNNGYELIAYGTDGLWDFPYLHGRSRFIDVCRFAPATVIQFLSGRLLLPPGSGESLIMIFESKSDMTESAPERFLPLTS